MYYELYIDILYLVNFMMDYLVLLIVREITKNASGHIRILLASVVGSLLTCIVVVIPIPYVGIKFVLFHIVISTIMIHIGFKIKDVKNFISTYISMYITSFLFGGVIQYFQQYIKAGSLYFAMTVVSYWIVRGIWWFIRCRIQNQKKWLEVELYIDEHVFHVIALLDSGNSLVDEHTHKPINIVEKSILDVVDVLNEKYGIRYISYHSLGNYGTIPIITLDKIHICGENEYWIEKPLIGLSDDKISCNGSYRMILNPNIL